MFRGTLPLGDPLKDAAYNTDYSIALEYKGPSLSYELPRVNPVDDPGRRRAAAAAAVARPESQRTQRRATGSPVQPFLPSPVPHVSAGVTCTPSQSSCSPSGYGSSEPVASVPQAHGFSSPSPASSFNDILLPHAAFPRNPAATMSAGKRGSAASFERPPRRDIRSAGLPNPAPVTTRVTATAAAAAPLHHLGVVPEMGRKRKSCSLCGKGWCKRKVSCFVCRARYCSSCALRAMGSMPEGRKCVECIGRPIDESRRWKLGKRSGSLTRLLSAVEIRQLMKAERECPANQLHPQQVVVNGLPLRPEEMAELVGCPVPPKNLKPGRYWYDKQSGLWGKEGQKPCRIVSSNLNLSGKLKPDASNGNTQVYFNGREITKTEMRVLKLANVHCRRGTRISVYYDGRYGEEGQNYIKGNIWRNATTRFACSLFSLPVPKPSLRGPKDTSSGRTFPDYLEQQKVKKLLLLGPQGSGASTIFKQAKILYGSRFTNDELKNIKVAILRNTYTYLSILLEGRERFEEEELTRSSIFYNEVIGDHGSKTATREKQKKCIYSISTKFKKFSDWLLDIIATGDLDAFFPAATLEYAPLVDEIWKDVAIQETYKRRDELLCLPDVAEYFLNRVLEVSKTEYQPSEKDILYAEGATRGNGLSFVEFSLDGHASMPLYYNDNIDIPDQPLTKYQLIRVDANGMTDGCKWADMFEDVRAVIFCVSLNDYDRYSISSNGSHTLVLNKMIESKKLFETLIRHPCFRNIPVVLMLNKFDLFKEKVTRVPLSECKWFNDFCPMKDDHDNQSVAHQAYFYVALKFKNLYASITQRKLFVWQTTAWDRVNVDKGFRYVSEVLKWEDVKNDCFPCENSFYSTDISSLPFVRME